MERSSSEGAPSLRWGVRAYGRTLRRNQHVVVERQEIERLGGR